jgi:hypothetical protein
MDNDLRGSGPADAGPSGVISVGRDRILWYAAAAAVFLYILGMLAAGRLGWQHLLLLVLAWACVTGRTAPNRFVRDWWPFILFWLSYDVMRLGVPALLRRVEVESLFRWESTLFLSPEGVIWPFYFAHWIARHGTSLSGRLLIGCCNLIYMSQLFVVPVVVFLIWLRRHRLLFRRLLWSFAVLHVLTLCIYIAYPAAPPWWVYENGPSLPTPGHSMPVGFPTGSMLSGLFHLSPNRFAAVPSLHGAYPLLLMLVLAMHGVRSRWIWIAGLYAVSMWFACIFLDQHYIVDLLIGAVLVVAALPAAWFRGHNTYFHGK